MAIWTKYDKARDVHGFPDWGVKLLHNSSPLEYIVFLKKSQESSLKVFQRHKNK